MADATVQTSSPEPTRASSSYGQILKATAMIGGSTLVNVAFTAVRMKAIAVLLGPGGVGVMSLYSSMSDLTQTLAGLGIQASGVRQIAEAAGAEDENRVARTARILRRVTFLLGAVGAVLMALLAWPLSSFTFGDHSHAGDIALLSLLVLFGLVSSGQMALLQGLRRIGDMARISMLSAVFSAAVSIPLVYLFGHAGIVPALVAVGGATLCLTWWYSSRLALPEMVLRLQDVRHDLAPLLRLGFVFMSSGFLTVGASYAVRLIVLKLEGVEAAGLYQAAWALGGLYAGFILQAMGTDFYPRLTAAARDDALCNRLVNEQAHISLLLSGPGLLATLTVAPLLMEIFYSQDFHPAADLLRWLCLGMMLRIIAWPMGFIILAKGASRIFFWSEVAATIVHVGLAALLVRYVGLNGAGVAFVGLYVWHTALVYILVRRLSGFRWTRANLCLCLMLLPSAGLVFYLFHILPLWPATAIGASIAILSGIYSISALLRVLPTGNFYRRSRTRQTFPTTQP